eukprot:scaffold13644_cov33-Tisochrysis_lutea.AAC.4
MACSLVDGGPHGSDPHAGRQSDRSGQPEYGIAVRRPSFPALWAPYPAGHSRPGGCIAMLWQGKSDVVVAGLLCLAFLTLSATAFGFL